MSNGQRRCDVCEILNEPARHYVAKVFNMSRANEHFCGFSLILAVRRRAKIFKTLFLNSRE